MPYSNLQRGKMIIPYTVHAGTVAATASETTKAAICTFAMPWNCTVVGLQASYAIETGTGPAVDLTLERSTTVLSTLAQVAAINTVSRNSGLGIRCDAGESLNIKADFANTDNTMDGLLIVLECQLIPDA